MDILTTLSILRPGKSISFKENHIETISNVVWLNEKTYTPEQYNKLEDASNLIFNEEVQLYTVTPFTIPTELECQEYWDTILKNKISNKNLRKKRDTLLSKTDKYATIDYPHPTEEAKRAWLDYRQALRDLPANTTDPDNPVWPEAPTP